MTSRQRIARCDELATRTGSLIAEIEAMEKAGVKSRPLSIAKTKLEEAKHRLADEMAEQSTAS